MRSVARCYLVISPEYGEVIPILDDGTGPTEYGHDVVYAFARNARRAKVLALRWFRRQYAGKWRHNWIEDGNPFTGMTVDRMEFCKQCGGILSRPCFCCEGCDGTGRITGTGEWCGGCDGTGRIEGVA